VTDLRVVRTIQARRVDVFDAWVDPERLRAWWGPPGIEVVELEHDLRVGGSYRIVMQAPDGEQRALVWSFREIAPPERLVYGWRWDAGAESLVAVRFHDLGDRTEIEITHTGIVDDAEAAMHEHGWAACLDGLDAILNRVV
jgi:uncharacterized protein YndB with AHSA1/START domain